MRCTVVDQDRDAASFFDFVMRGRALQAVQAWPALTPEVGLSYVLNTPDDRRAMLERIGAASVADLFDNIPPELRLGRQCPQG